MVGATERSAAQAKPAASLDIEGEPSRAVHGEGHGSGEDPGDAAARDSPAYEGAERSEGGGGNWRDPPRPERVRGARGRALSYNRCGAGKWAGRWEGVGGGRSTGRAGRTT